MCVCVRGVGVRGLFRILLWELSHAGGGGVRTPGPTLLLCSTIMAIWNRIVNYIHILAVVSDDALL